MNELQIFNFESTEIRTQLIDGEAWFVAKDVCDVLEISNSRDAVSRLDDDEKSSVGLTDGSQTRNYSIINEFGLYSLVLSSRKKEAKEFKRWMTHEVIPAIRKTGSYHSAMSQEDIMIATLETQKEIKQRLTNVTNDVENLKKEIDLSRLQKSKLSQLVKKNVMAAIGGKKSNGYQLYRVAVSEHWREIKNYFEVASYEEIPKLRFEEAMDIAEMWNPSIELAFEIKRLNNQIEMDV